MREPLPLAMKIGSPPTPRNARTGELTPPGNSCCALRKSSWDLGRINFGPPSQNRSLRRGRIARPEWESSHEFCPHCGNAQVTPVVKDTSKELGIASPMSGGFLSAPCYTTCWARASKHDDVAASDFLHRLYHNVVRSARRALRPAG